MEKKNGSYLVENMEIKQLKTEAEELIHFNKDKSC
jgi:hypothetical protein